MPPIRSRSTFYNYKHTFSIVLIELVDADYRLLWSDVGCNARISDGGVFNLQQAFTRRSDVFPDAAPCPGDDRSHSYYICADDAFPLQENTVKSFSYKDMLYERKIYYYILPRARRVVVNAFGILTNRSRAFLAKSTGQYVA